MPLRIKLVCRLSLLKDAIADTASTLTAVMECLDGYGHVCLIPKE